MSPPTGSYSHNDYMRERELFRYCQGLDEAADVDIDSLDSLKDLAPTSPNTTLTALAQLCALRLDAPRAMISVVDKETQYFIAEATQSVTLSNTRKSEREDDGLWVGCTAVPKAGRLCERTIELPPIAGQYPCFTVTDLTKDERFNHLPFVKGPPFFKFYAGTPLTTHNGVNIGSLFVLDDRVRPELDEDQTDCLGTIAKIVMQSMQLNSEAAERKRSLKMSQGLQAFQDGKDSLGLGDQGASGVDYESSVNQREDPNQGWTNDGDKGGLQSRNEAKSTNLGEPRMEAEATAVADTLSPFDSHADGNSKDSSKDIEQLPNSTFVRAANLLREALDLHNTGGVVFYGADARYYYQEAASSDLEGSEDDFARSPRRKNRSSASSGLSHEPPASKQSDILSFSTADVHLGTSKDLGKTRSFNPMTEHLLQQLLQRYPRGNMWCFDEDGEPANKLPLNASSRSYSVSGRVQLGRNIPSRDRKRQTEAKILYQYFPNVRSLLLAPLWDSSTARWSGAYFCYSTTVRQVFSMEGELSFLMTFGNSVMAEANRLAYIAAERQKGDFIGSISHELRSPLHGILASAEFLAETEFDAFQNSLVDTISSCGRTLLDTVNHILDYSKINKYERSFFNARKSRVQKSAISMRTQSAVAVPLNKEAPPLMNIYSTTDVAAIAEEVVEGVYAGQVYQDISSTEIAYMSPETKGKIAEHGAKSSQRALQADSKGLLATKEVEVILDIEKGDYVFTTQPGALRRILMNLFGNSLKYTSQGFIVVSIRLHELDNERGPIPEEKLLEMVIQDSGKGISTSYLRNHLFTPFTQEDVLATGVGLGLSIVKSIVNMLNGTIEFESQLDKGTKVSVKVPLMRLPGTDTPKSTPSTIASNSSTSTSLQGLQSEHSGKQVVLYGFDNDKEAGTASIRNTVLNSYVTEWFGLRANYQWMNSADIVLIDENDLPAFWAINTKRVPTVVLCGTSRPQVAPPSHRLSVVEFVSKPFGPYKLAKALFVCLEKAKDLAGDGLACESTDTFPPESPLSSETGTIVPEMGKLSINAEGRISQLTIRENKSPTGSSRTLSSEMSSRSNLDENLSKNQRQDFPFPSQEIEESSDAEAQQSRPDLIKRDSRRPKITHRATEPFVKTSYPVSSAVTKVGEIATASAAQATAEIAAPEISLSLEEARESAMAEKLAAPVADPYDRPPRLLLVDDNRINLRLLETYMRKRKYNSVDSAENGQLAIDAAVTHEEGYDIIFMDISMPIVNGFEATRAVREIEHTRRATQADDGNGDGRRKNHALIIALTGLASSRDQTEAYKSGVDLFMTKPVSFKEVGRLLDNWEAHGSETRMKESEA